MDIYINHELGTFTVIGVATCNSVILVTTKSSDSDYFTTDMIFLREGFNENFVRTAMSVSGIFGDDNKDADELKSSASHVTYRRKIAEKVTRNGEDFYRYNIVTTINHGLARQKIPLPSGIPIQLIFKRAEAIKALLQISDQAKSGGSWTYDDKVISLISPTLSCYFVESAKADSFYAKTKMYDVSVDFLDYSLRRELLLDSVSEFSIKLFEGPLPSYLVMGLMEPEVFSGSLEYSALKFESHNLDTFELQFDSQPIVGHPLRMKDTNPVEFFTNYLRTTNRFQNPYSDGSLTFDDFKNSNFLIYTNLKADKYVHGQLTAKLRFNSVLPKKLLCIFIPIYEKKIIFDGYKNVQVQS